MATTSEIRTAFLDYFARNEHEIVDSSSLVPRNDPSLLFANAGMVQFKNVFTGTESRPYKRATTSQKCVRAGGKHNDLENVGYTARHHTFFEMLGNFSFGDYFKDVAIELAWKLLTKEYDLPAERLLVTVYSDDDEAADLWKRIANLPEEKIIRISTQDNFWQMGDTGPCGPCSEIFFDHGENVPGGPPGSPNEDGDRFIEIWNLVFMQFEQHSPGNRVALPRPSIDTGMGLERIAAVLQGKHDNYDIDLMRSLIEASAEETNTQADGENSVSHRVIADHLRACSFLIADGVLPSNEGRGYVLRRIMRRAMRHAHLLGSDDPLMHRLVPTLVSAMGLAFNELVRAEALITETFKLEEERFKQTLERGLRLLDEEISSLDEGDIISGEVAFKLYDTYGFPIDLTQDIARGQGLSVGLEDFDKSMEKQREAARQSWSGSGEEVTDEVWFDVRENIGATEFLGYDTVMAEGIILAIVVGGKIVEYANIGDSVALVLNQTPFYAESGGQIGDTGSLCTNKGSKVEIIDTQKKLGELHVHFGTILQEQLKVGDIAELNVNIDRRDRLRANHSATHLLHQALRNQLGEHVTQKGSLVAPDRLRFDISQPTPISKEDLTAVEDIVNQRILLNSKVDTLILTPEKAIEAGALALFGEKYGDEVRVVSMGGLVGSGTNEINRKFSVELCGGTHVSQTGDIGLFKIISEGGVSAGVRRIEALTGIEARRHLGEQSNLLTETADILKTSQQNVPVRVAQLIEERRKLERDLADARRKIATGGAVDQDTRGADIGGITFVGRSLKDVPPRELKALVDDIKVKIGSGIVAVTDVYDDKGSIVVGVTADLVKRFSAIDLVRIGVAEIGGKGGGGRSDMAQGGGPNAEKADEALKAIESEIKEQLSK
ncbi:MAG: alanine--tRNA ligase [Alphaproteobacteria bacterium]|nr:alanine--tRNA ligase [Alphaproteobacteria bacterium]PPR13587.1 MAG: Alanine--tRNA ligase [Alphaproteobacteria bacterium MarineAlpha12_Bin1]|tara:strand:- start:11391 stop:14066 length:2676 start_codon:yes stop_codon:yes gene_type:complete